MINIKNQTITLRPEANRPDLESRTAQKLADGIIEDSRRDIGYNPWVNGETPRVMLLVPPYTRIRRPLQVILENLERDENNPTQLQEDKDIIKTLRSAGIEHLEEMKRAGIPMGLLRIGTAAKNAGYEVKIIDGVYEGWNNEREYFETSEGSTMLSYGLSKQELAERIKRFKPHIVGITIDYTHQWGNARELADLVKTVDENTVVVMGGTHAHGLPADVLLDSPTDYVVKGQADRTFPELLDTLTGKIKKPISMIDGIVYRKQGTVVENKRRAFLPSIDTIAIPDLSLVDLSLYSGKFHSAGERQLDNGHLLYGFTSIGCNTRCTFCAIPSVQGGWVPMKEKKLDEYLQYITDNGVTEFIVEDDHLFHDPDWALTVFRKLKGYDLPWVEEGGVGLFNLIALLPEVQEDFIVKSVSNQAVFNKTLDAKRRGITTELMIKALAGSGCYSLYLAVESANDDSLDTSHKPTLNAQEEYTRKVVGLFNQYGIKATCGLMLGFLNPNSRLHVETRGQIQRSIAYGRVLREAGATYINPFIFTPLPGAPHFPELVPYAIKNTDEGFSHEFGTINAPNGKWTRDEMSLLRAYSILQTNGIDGYAQILKTGTWPVDRKKIAPL